MNRGPFRRRRRRRAGSLAGDPFILFLDAITDALGVVMFLLLMVVLAARASNVVSRLGGGKQAAAAALQEERDALAVELAALPPAGDPEVADRWRAAQATLASLRPQLDRAAPAIRMRVNESQSKRVALTSLDTEVQTLEARVKAQAATASVTPSLVRVSRFKSDARKPVLLGLNQGALSALKVSHDTKSIAPPASGTAVPTAAAARAALETLLSGQPRDTYRVELVVWANSFAQAKLVEEALAEMGYDVNPLPVVDGGVLEPGAGGVQ
ncbi:MAG: hypothetical protein U0636_00490 [Phycisphaerales bacterium]